MTAWALWDRLIPVVGIVAAYVVGYRFGRAQERLARILDSVRKDTR